jgi:transposase InsO family protein
MGKHIRLFHSDCGLEFENVRVKRILEKIGADQTFSNPYTSPQNGVAERGNRTVVSLARTVMIAAGLESKKMLWAECVNYCIDILNIVTIHDTLNISAYEILN